jgi:hypothetical protein
MIDVFGEADKDTLLAVATIEDTDLFTVVTVDFVAFPSVGRTADDRRNAV